jgi:hypothetical protein
MLQETNECAPNSIDDNRGVFVEKPWQVDFDWTETEDINHYSGVDFDW